MIAYISIGNSDDKLTQVERSEFITDVTASVAHYGDEIHGFWLSPVESRWQNACWCVEYVEDSKLPAHRLQAQAHGLAMLSRKYRQRAIAWAEVDKTVMIGEDPS